MKTNLITSPTEAIVELRRFFAENGVTTFEEDSTTRFSFRAPCDDVGIYVTAYAMPQPLAQVSIFTRILSPIDGSMTEALRICNYLSTGCLFAHLLIPDDFSEFVLESMLMLGDGNCLRSQLTDFAASHMSVVGQLTPILDGVARGQLDYAGVRATLRRAYRRPDNTAPSDPFAARSSSVRMPEAGLN